MLKYNELPIELQSEEVKPYYEMLRKKQISLFCKRIFDIFFSLLGLIILSPIFLIISIAIKIDSKGPIIFSQIRITQYCKKFKIYKFRSMEVASNSNYKTLTVNNDSRITKVGKLIRKYKLDELPQLFNVLIGNMSLVGARPELDKYVNFYTPEMMSTLLLPAGITSLASLYYKDEVLLLEENNTDNIYIYKVLPEKMKWNLQEIANYSISQDVLIIIKTIIALFSKN